MFLPTTKTEYKALGWKELDIVLVTGDAYIDSPFSGVAVIGHVLVSAGFRVGVIGQPKLDSEEDILRLGIPRLFWGVTGGCIDSMVANRTASGRKRMRDDYTPGGANRRRPDRATIQYTNLIRRFSRSSTGTSSKRSTGTSSSEEPRPIVLGGIEASLRRIAHYDAWTDSIRRSVLFDAKADYLLYGMAERSIVELAEALRDGLDPAAVRGLCYISKEAPDGALALPAYSECTPSTKAGFAALTTAFDLFYKSNDPATARTITQRHDNRYLVQNPPAKYLTEAELDAVYALPFERELHPYHQKEGAVKALETIRFSISTHRGCYGECGFCAIAVHEGRRVRSRSKASIVAEAVEITKHPLFKGRIPDVGGPTANMYKSGCTRMETKGCCPSKSCVSPKVCPVLKFGHTEQIELLRELRAVTGVKKVVVASGLRHDMILADKKTGEKYLKELVTNHVSGQLRIAPEHSEPGVLKAMGKEACDRGALVKFRELFYRFTKEAGLKQFLSYYFMAAHPGCTLDDMNRLKKFAMDELGILPESVQLFTPTPSTISTLAYWTGLDSATAKPCFVEKSAKGREAQKEAVLAPATERAKGYGKERVGRSASYRPKGYLPKAGAGKARKSSRPGKNGNGGAGGR
ncbi:MAG: YgiQ family radical SAM protein [Proteobacteria bacterium]|nr:YgiQ family radical SAM protein [Pseudomonadota bacterium]